MEVVKKKFVIGFIFNEDRTKVVLIEKKKDDWQKNRLNGLGGKIEENETDLEAMIREAKEESGIDIGVLGFRLFGRITYPDCVLSAFVTIKKDLEQAELYLKHWISEEGIVKIYEVKDLHLYNTVHNLLWMIEMARENVANYFEVTVSNGESQLYENNL